jgi:hypothetical protein
MYLLLQCFLLITWLYPFQERGMTLLISGEIRTKVNLTKEG